MTALQQHYASLGIHYPEPSIRIYRTKLTDEQRQAARRRALDRYRAKRNAWVAAGLTTQGTVRIKPQYKSLRGMSEAERVEYIRKQKRAWYERNEMKTKEAK